MNIRNAKHVRLGLIDCEYEHPVYGWIPFTASSSDTEDIGRAIYALASAGDVAPATVDVVNIQAAIVLATQLRLDAFAKTRNYDGILSASTYATSTVPKFPAEGQYAVDARDQTWSALYALMGEVLAGALPMPESFADIEPLLPELAWPV